MSIVSSLMLVFLCFSFHACNARSLGSHHSISKKNDQMQNPATVARKPDKEYHSVPGSPGEATSENRFREKRVNQPRNVEKRVNEPGKHFQAKADRKSESPSSVSWRVPHRKRGVQNQGYNLDYLPPRTHPPVHN